MSNKSLRVCLGLAAVMMSPGAVCMAEILPISGVDAGIDGSPPYLIQHITVGDYTVAAGQLATGTSSGSAGAGTVVANADDLDLDTIVIRTPRADPIWTIVSFGGQPLWQDSNGVDPDFFLFEVGLDQAFTVQAILAGGGLGQAVSVGVDKYAGTGLHATVPTAGGQEIGGLCFEVTDLLDVQGNALDRSAAIEGIQIDGVSLDPATFVVVVPVVPEPSTVTLLGLGSLVLTTVRKRQ